MAMEVIVWTCVVVFILTAVITLLGITNRITIDKTYLNALFTALILEIVAIGIIGFRSTVQNDLRGAFVRITYPLADLSVDRQEKMFVAGVATMRSDQTLTCKIATASDTTAYSQVALKPKGFFDLAYDLSGRTFPLAVATNCAILEGEKIVTADTSRVRLTRTLIQP